MTKKKACDQEGVDAMDWLARAVICKDCKSNLEGKPWAREIIQPNPSRTVR
jgi:hypothetical protein